MNRRHFIARSAGAGVSLLLSRQSGWATAPTDFPVVRTTAGQRNFTSSAVEQTIERMHKTIRDPELAWLFENCFPNTLDTTVQFRNSNAQPDTFVITGDIDAMWLRDSTAQVWPYLPLTKQDPALRQLIAGVIRRQTQCILRDPYANAFYAEPTKEGEWKKDFTDMKPGIHERKWELDSLCYPIRLAYHYWQTTGDTSPFDADWLQAMQLALQTCRQQQRKTTRGPYQFGRETAWSTDTVPGNGYGNPTRPIGLIHSIFRPSDDATVFPFYVPSNWFTVVSFRQLATMIDRIAPTGNAGMDLAQFASECRALASEVETALKAHAIINHPKYGRMYAMEIDGYGNRLLQDDANVPNLLALPYLGVCPASDPVYKNTRRFVLSPDNPYFFQGKAAEGIGSPHTLISSIWPMSIIMRALTSTDDQEILAQLRFLKKTHAGTGFMHESFDQDDPAKFTRKWFAWANTLFGELMLKVAAERPHLLNKPL
ncbi:glycoside hydrolase family 125 protein [Spirosoma taeanense]|uniref:Glycoside hydrolase family 125 protein n=1 Tax=Spirosoma taeanense TaxID=2735870 RepID=A0A6M5Y5T2_9BACT|nr:glycoside hydrolase family 125 protein [Spirosoma taeanense]QJW88052.1 glycoside hydrolase family 125 protein [Spirosoma taeanense]